MRFEVIQVPASHFGWLVQRLGLALSADLRAIAAVDTSRQERCLLCGAWHAPIRGMVGYNNWTPAGVEMHVAVDNPIAVRALRDAAFVYAFEDAGKHHARAVIRASNERALRVVAKLGMREIYRYKDGWDIGEDLVVCRLNREDWHERRNARQAR